MLIDTNVILSLLLDQNDYKSTEKLFAKIDRFKKTAIILDFTLFSVCINMDKRHQQLYLFKFLEGIKDNKNYHIYRPTLKEIIEVNNLQTNLNFDDKIHYYLAKKKNLQLVSYDADFDKTDLKRLTPAQALDELF